MGLSPCRAFAPKPNPATTSLETPAERANGAASDFDEQNHDLSARARRIGRLSHLGFLGGARLLRLFADFDDITFGIADLEELRASAILNRPWCRAVFLKVPVGLDKLRAEDEWMLIWP